MLSPWKVRKFELLGSEFYQVYRTTDAARAADRIETCGGYWTTEKEAAGLADRLNKEENDATYRIKLSRNRSE